jgi:hypothetical protein
MWELFCGSFHYCVQTHICPAQVRFPTHFLLSMSPPKQRPGPPGKENWVCINFWNSKLHQRKKLQQWVGAIFNIIFTFFCTLSTGLKNIGFRDILYKNYSNVYELAKVSAYWHCCESQNKQSERVYFSFFVVLFLLHRPTVAVIYYFSSPNSLQNIQRK